MICWRCHSNSVNTGSRLPIRRQDKKKTERGRNWHDSKQPYYCCVVVKFETRSKYFVVFSCKCNIISPVATKAFGQKIAVQCPSIVIFFILKTWELLVPTSKQLRLNNMKVEHRNKIPWIHFSLLFFFFFSFQVFKLMYTNPSPWVWYSSLCGSGRVNIL
jgi:hypothetical protein